jgi:hypothetical protein
MQLSEHANQPRKTGADFRREEAERTKALWLRGAIVNPLDIQDRRRDGAWQDEPTARGMHAGRVLRLDGIAARQIKLELRGVLDADELRRWQERECAERFG